MVIYPQSNPRHCIAKRCRRLRILRKRFLRNAARLAVIASPIRPTGYTAVPNPNCCKNGNVFSAARCPSAMASSAR